MTEHDDSSGLFSTGRRALTLGLFLAVTMNGFEALGVSAAMPRVADELRGGRLYGLAFGVFMLGHVASIPIAGAEADRRGSRRPFALGLLVFAIGLSLAASAPSMLIFVGARAVSGLGAGAIAAVNLVAIGRAYPEHLRSKMFAVVSTAWVLPGAIGPGVSGWVADHASWRWVFAGLLPLIPVVAALVLPALGRVVGAEAAPPPGSANVTATALRLALATASIVGGISVGNRLATALLVAAGGSVGFPALRRLLPPGTLRLQPGLPAVVAAVSLLMTSFVTAETFIPRVLHDIRGRSTSVAAIALTFGTLAWTLGSWIQARAPQWWGDGRRMAAATFLLGAGTASVLAVLWTSVPLVVVYVGWTAGGIGMGLAFNSASEASLRLADADAVGRVASATTLAPSLGIAVMTAVTGRIAGDGTTTHLRSVYIMLIGVTVFTAYAMWRTGLPGPAPGTRNDGQRRIARATRSVPNAVKIAK